MQRDKRNLEWQGLFLGLWSVELSPIDPECIINLISGFLRETECPHECPDQMPGIIGEYLFRWTRQKENDQFSDLFRACARGDIDTVCELTKAVYDDDAADDDDDNLVIVYDDDDRNEEEKQMDWCAVRKRPMYQSSDEEDEDQQSDTSHSTGSIDQMVSGSKHAVKTAALLTRDINTGSTPLMTACYHGYIEVVKKLLKTKKIDVNEQNYIGTTALGLARMAGHSTICQLLIKHNVDIDQFTEKGLSALFSAVESGHLDVVKVLLRANAEANLC